MTSLSELRNRVRIRADIEKQLTRYPDVELNQYINDSYKQLYGLLLRKMLIRPEKLQTIVTDGAPAYVVEDDHYATLAVFYSHDSDTYVRLRRHKATDRPFGVGSDTRGNSYTYRIAEVAGVKEIEFYPTPTGETYYLSYVPLPGDFENDTDSISAFLGWDEYIVLDAAIKVLSKENTSNTELKKKLKVIQDRIEDEAEAIEMTEALSITDVRQERRYSDPAEHRWYRPLDYLL